MKKILYIFLISCFSLTIISCGEKEESSSCSSSSETTTENTGYGDIMTLLSSANVDDGKKIFKKCTACHSIAKDGTNKIGPALWGVMGRLAGSVSDY